MNIQIVLLSDMHIADETQLEERKVEWVIKAISSLEKPDINLLAITGDIAKTGKKEEYKIAFKHIWEILVGLPANKKDVPALLLVPGNHDIFFSKELQNKYIAKKKSEYLKGDLKDLQDDYFKFMTDFFESAKQEECVWEQNCIRKQVFEFDGTKIGFVLVNSAPCSLLGGNCDDMGDHFFSDEQLNDIEKATEANINVFMMHHGPEWFNPTVKSKLRQSFINRYSIVLTGHEHENIAMVCKINQQDPFLAVQSSAYYDKKAKENGFDILRIDTDKCTIKAYSFVLKDDIYIPNEVAEAVIKRKYNSGLKCKDEFLTFLSQDENNDALDDIYVFPGMEYSTINDNHEAEKGYIETEDDLFKLFEKKERIIINGASKNGKTTLAKRIVSHYLYSGKTPLLCQASSIREKLTIDRIITNAFKEMYDESDDARVRFDQMDKSERVVILDDADLIKSDSYKAIVEYLTANYEKVIILSKKEDLDVKQEVEDALDEINDIKMAICPFYFKTRKQLISKAITKFCSQDQNGQEDVQPINDLINTQIKFFNLNPGFIVSFVKQYEIDKNFQFSSGTNAFNVVYETTIKNRIIDNSHGSNPQVLISVLEEIAYKMHFDKKVFSSVAEIIAVIEDYNKKYRQRVNSREFLNIVTNASILTESNNDYRFKDRTLLAYFVAKAINQKAHLAEDDPEYIEAMANFEYILRNLCFGINSDIVLFLALITDNNKFISIIMNKAEEHFKDKKELSFDSTDMDFLKKTKLSVKMSLPTQEEKNEHESIISKQEEEMKLSDIIEISDEYDFGDEDFILEINQRMISYKYVEILSKALPAFCQSMKTEQQDRLVNNIYSCPNKFLASFIKPIADDYDQFVNYLYVKNSEMRRNKKLAETSLEAVSKIAKSTIALTIFSVYQYVAQICASSESIAALDAFDYQKNRNYEMMNLMMSARLAGVSTFKEKAFKLDGKQNYDLEKSMLQLTVRDYYMRNKVPSHGDGQALTDRFFGQGDRKRVLLDNTRK